MGTGKVLSFKEALGTQKKSTLPPPTHPTKPTKGKTRKRLKSNRALQVVPVKGFTRTPHQLERDLSNAGKELAQGKVRAEIAVHLAYLISISTSKPREGHEWCFKSYRALGKELNLDRWVVQRATKWLCERGFFYRKSVPGLGVTKTTWWRLGDKEVWEALGSVHTGEIKLDFAGSQCTTPGSTTANEIGFAGSTTANAGSQCANVNNRLPIDDLLYNISQHQTPQDDVVNEKIETEGSISSDQYEVTDTDLESIEDQTKYQSQALIEEDDTITPQTTKLAKLWNESEKLKSVSLTDVRLLRYLNLAIRLYGPKHVEAGIRNYREVREGDEYFFSYNYSFKKFFWIPKEDDGRETALQKFIPENFDITKYKKRDVPGRDPFWNMKHKKIKWLVANPNKAIVKSDNSYMGFNIKDFEEMDIKGYWIDIEGYEKSGYLNLGHMIWLEKIMVKLIFHKEDLEGLKEMNELHSKWQDFFSGEANDYKRMYC